MYPYLTVLIRDNEKRGTGQIKSITADGELAGTLDFGQGLEEYEKSCEKSLGGAGTASDASGTGQFANADTNFK